MTNIIELIVKLNEDELEDVGVDAVALVENPAIELPFLAFSTQETFVEPKAGESEDDFIGRCVPELINEGYEQSQAAAICYSMYEGQMSKEDRKKWEEYVLDYVEKNGETFDPTKVTYVDGTKQKFSLFEDFLDGVKALGLLTNREAAQTSTKMYRYAGPKAERPFCRALQASNKLFKYEQILEMGNAGLNSNMGHNRQAYSIWSFQGGPNCKHYWEEIEVFTGDNGRLIFVSNGPATGNAGTSNEDLPLNGYYNQTTKKASEIAYAISQSRRGAFSIVDEEQRIVVGPVLIPNKLIKRLDAQGKEYFVFFSEQTVRDISEILFKRNLQNNTNVEHDTPHTNDTNTLLESWVVDNPKMDKAMSLGFDVPKGTLMQSRRINDEKVWQDVKNGKLRGFSVEGVFIEKATQSKELTDDQIFSKILDILNQIKE